jgi:hypothetical protein
MNTILRVLLGVAFASLTIAFIGCSKDSYSSIGTPPATTPQVALAPYDGSGNVRLDESVRVAFAKPVDRAIVQRNFHLISQKAMVDSMCPVSTTMQHGDMMSAMSDTAKMRHLDEIHATNGMFLWNSDTTYFTFRPDSLLSPKTQYMVHLGPEMIQMMEVRMGGMSSMGNHGSGMMSKDMMFHFTTLDTASSSGSGHAGHH